MNPKKLRHVVKPSLETLDERITPAAFAAGHVHAAVAGHVHAHAVHHRVAHHGGLAFGAAAVQHQAGAASTSGGAFRGRFTHSSGPSNSGPPFAPASQAIVADTSSSTSASTSQTSFAPVTDASGNSPTFVPTSSDPADVQHGPLAKAGQDLIQVYLDYQKFVQNGGTGTFQTSESSLIRIRDTTVGVDIQVAGDFNAGIAELTNAGMQITATDPNTQIVEGYVQINSLPTLVKDPVVATIAPMYLPTTHGGGGSFGPR